MEGHESHGVWLGGVGAHQARLVQKGRHLGIETAHAHVWVVGAVPQCVQEEIEHLPQLLALPPVVKGAICHADERRQQLFHPIAEIALAADDAAGARNAVAEAVTDLPSHQKETTS